MGGIEDFGTEDAGRPCGICTFGFGLDLTGTELLRLAAIGGVLSVEAGVGMPAGEATELGTMKSSKFIGSLDWSAEGSTDLRSFAMPLGVRAGGGGGRKAVEGGKELEALAC